MSHGHLKRFAVPPGHAQTDLGVILTLEQVREPERFEGVPGAYAGVVVLVDEPEGEDALFLMASDIVLLSHQS